MRCQKWIEHCKLILLILFTVTPISLVADELLYFYRDSKTNYVELSSVECSYMIDDTYSWEVDKVGATLKVTALGLSKRGALLIVFCPGKEDNVYSLSYSNTLKFDDINSNGNLISNRNTYIGTILNSSPTKTGVDLLLNDRSYEQFQLFVRGGKGRQMFTNEWTPTNNGSFQVVHKFDKITVNYGISENRYLSRQKNTTTAGFVVPHFNLTFKQNDWTYLGAETVDRQETDYEILASFNYIYSFSVRMKRNRTSDFIQFLLPFNTSLGKYGSLNLTYKNEILKTSENSDSTNIFQTYHILRRGASRQFYTRLDIYCPSAEPCAMNRFDVNWKENFSDWQNDLIVSFNRLYFQINSLT